MVQVVISGVLMRMVVVVGAGSVSCDACYYGADGCGGSDGCGSLCGWFENVFWCWL